MEISDSVEMLSALAQPTRLETFRMLVRHEPEGLAAGRIAALLDIPANTSSAHLAILARAGLVVGVRHGRSIVYRADLDALRGLLLFLVTDCCAGSPDICAPLLAELSYC